MEATSAPVTTQSTTIADLLPRAVERFGERVAQKHKLDGEWRELGFSELGEIVSEIGRGLIDLGVAPGERVSMLCTTRIEWTWCSFAISQAGAVVVPIYPTNSPEECEWVAGNSESVVVVCEDATQVAKIEAVRERLPRLREIVVIEGAVDGTVGLEQLRARGRERQGAELEERTRAVGKGDPYTFIYTSGTTGPPKGCVLTHGNYRAVLDMVAARGIVGDGDEDLIYLFLPLAHAFGLLLMLVSADRGVPIAYWGGDTAKIIAELSEVRPTYLPSVPRIFEKLYTFVTSQVDPETIERATRVGLAVRELESAGRPVPAELQADYDAFDATLFGSVRAAFGGRLREAVTGAAPIAKQILEFFYAAGVPVMEGYGMTETSTTATGMRPGEHRFGSVGRAHPGVEIRIAPEDGEILLKGANIFHGYHNNDDASFGAVIDGWLHTGDVGRLDADGFLFITGRKKDIIITAGGKNLTPANLENDLKQTRYVSQAMMHGDRRPFPSMLITLDEEEIVPWARERGISDLSVPALAEHPEVQALIQSELNRANAKYANVEQVKRFFILPHDLSQETGELTPTLKVKRAVVNELYADRFDALYR